MDTSVLPDLVANLDAVALEASVAITGGAGVTTAVRYINSVIDATKADLALATVLPEDEAAELVELCRHRLVDARFYLIRLGHRGVVVQDGYGEKVMDLVGSMLRSMR